ncbi:MAG: sugar transferase, partial [Planctomycetota bacterium]
ALPTALLVGLANAIALKSVRRVLFLQERVGRDGKIFRIAKFRTMRPVQGSHMESWSSGADQQRVTRLGRFLRNAHLDELPQLWNVLVGDMGFMGPRPEMIEIEAWASEHILDFSERLQIRPGISGLAQITQGYTPKDVAAYQRKLDINLEYLERLSFWTDVRVFCGTIVWVLGRKGWKWEGSTFPAQGTEGKRSMTQTAPLPQEP